ncbi:glycosyl transferase, family 1 [Thermoproteus uzoniensis 768-20]|uniref:Glycosyl transferase, family 1 n=1 Tax=Thermoproteus uzoniensis (strain 768-20) TaxID=999630 RepID=F2L0N9_THEU7|nr:glycosyltransferase [Thermoproteus uzoniensis]AEA11518.1 glycosyl transferase, family 1 [Thermoproteus uzoniensis 768-20]
MKSIKLAIFGGRPSSWAGGHFTVLFNSAKALQYAGLDVEILNMCIDCSQFEYNIIDNIKILNIPSKVYRPFSLNFLGKISDLNVVGRIMRSSDYIITVDSISTFYFVKFKNKYQTNKNIKIFWEPGGNDLTCPLHTEICPYSNSYTETYGHAKDPLFFVTKCLPHILKSRKYTLYNTFIWPIYTSIVRKEIDGILASRGVYLEGCKLLGLEEKCKYIGFGIDENKFRFRSKDEVTEEFLKFLSNNLMNNDRNTLYSMLSKEYLFIGYIGSGKPTWKNVELLVKSFQYLARFYYNIVLIIIGREMDNLVNFLSGIEEDVVRRIFIVNKIPHTFIHYAYNIIDIFVNPSLLDSLEINTLEALMSGVITVASNRGNINDLLTKGINIPTFNPQVNHLVKTLKDIIDNIIHYRDITNKEIYPQVRKIFNLVSYGKRLKDALELID